MNGSPDEYDTCIKPTVLVTSLLCLHRVRGSGAMFRLPRSLELLCCELPRQVGQPLSRVGIPGLNVEVLDVHSWQPTLRTDVGALAEITPTEEQTKLKDMPFCYYTLFDNSVSTAQ